MPIHRPDGRAQIMARGAAQPDQPARPVIGPALCPRPRRDPWRVRGFARHAPHITLPVVKRRHIADAGPNRLRRRCVALLNLCPRAGEQRLKLAQTVADRCLEPFDAQRGFARGGIVGGTCHLERTAKCPRHRSDSGCVLEAVQNQRRLRLGTRQHLHRHFAEHTKGTKRPCHQLDQIIAGHVLHHAPTVLDHGTAPVDKAHPQQKIPRGPDRNTPRTADVARHDAADGGRAGGAQQPAMVHRLEREALVLGGQRLFDLGHRGARFRDQRQRTGLIQRDPLQPRDADNLTCRRQSTRTAPLNRDRASGVFDRIDQRLFGCDGHVSAPSS